MEHEIGEIFDIDGKWYQCLKSSKKEGQCNECAGYANPFNLCKRFEGCAGGRIFKELKKIGDPFTCNINGDGKMVTMQEYSLYDTNFINTSPSLMYVSDYKHKRIAIEVKQDKEDMGKEELKLRDFDIEAAKAGKPVCTRDGRMARVVCFDRKGDMPITALITNKDVKGNDVEEAYFYSINGRWDEHQEYRYDLMMLSEKKEGWINIYHDNENNVCAGENVFDSKEVALKFHKPNGNKVATIKIEWEE